MDAYPFGVVAVSRRPGQIICHHICLYPGPIDQNELDALAEELNTDPEFGLVGKIGNGVDMTTVDGEVLEFFKEQASKSDVIRKKDIEKNIRKR